MGLLSLPDCRIHQKHLELEPLCCLSSCLVRGGCYAVVVFEVIYTVATSLLIAFKIYDGGRMNYWDEIEPNFNSIVTHQVSLYILVLFNLCTLTMAAVLARGLLSFERKLIKAHWRFDFLALGFNVLALVLWMFALRWAVLCLLSVQY